MTLLNWEMAPDSLAILSDTLSLASDTARPRTFLTKVYPAPHINAVVTGTGLSELVTRFYFHMSGSMVADDVVHLTEFVPGVLRNTWAEFKPLMNSEATSTVYIFGIAKQSGQFVGYAFRSTADFKPDPLHYGLAAKPAPDQAELGAVTDLAGFVNLALVQQERDRALPRLERVGIGGDLWLYTFGIAEDGSLATNIQRVMRFPHYDDDHAAMLATLPQNAGHPYSALVLARDP